MINSVSITSVLSYFVKSLGGANNFAGGDSSLIFENDKVKVAFEREMILIGNRFKSIARQT